MPCRLPLRQTAGRLRQRLNSPIPDGPSGHTLPAMNQAESASAESLAHETASGARTASPEFPAAWFEGLSVYQDVLAAGMVVRPGQRDCTARWRLILPHLPRSGVVLDVGANFGWFGIQTAMGRPECLVLSAEADERSARVQRRALESYAAAGRAEAERIVLLTRRLVPRLVYELTAHGPPLAAALCLSVLHWMPEHRAFVQALGASSDRLFVEHPHRDELGAGDRAICAEIGDMAEYLRKLLPQHDVVLLGRTPCHRQPGLERPLWLAIRKSLRPEEEIAVPRPVAIDAAALARCEPSWPPQSVWRRALRRGAEPDVRLGVPTGAMRTGWGLREGRLCWLGSTDSFEAWRAERRLAEIPETALLAPVIQRRRAVRRFLGRLRQHALRWGRTR